MSGVLAQHDHSERNAFYSISASLLASNSCLTAHDSTLSLILDFQRCSHQRMPEDIMSLPLRLPPLPPRRPRRPQHPPHPP